MLLAAWASTRPTTDSRNRPQSTGGPALVRFASTASSPPINPDQMVIGNTAARVITSHLPTVSSGRDTGGLAVSRTSFQARNRSRRETGAWVAVSVTGAGAAVLMGSLRGAEETCTANVSRSRDAAGERGFDQRRATRHHRPDP